MKRKKLKRKIADLRKENQELKRSVLREKEANQMKSVFYPIYPMIYEHQSMELMV